MLILAAGLFGLLSYVIYYVQMKKRDPEARYETKTGSQMSYQGVNLVKLIKKLSIIFILSMIILSVGGAMITSYFSPLPTHTQSNKADP